MVRLAQVELERLGMEGLGDGFQQFVGDFPLNAEDQDGELTTGFLGEGGRHNVNASIPQGGSYDTQRAGGVGIVKEQVMPGGA